MIAGSCRATCLSGRQSFDVRFSLARAFSLDLTSPGLISTKTQQPAQKRAFPAKQVLSYVQQRASLHQSTIAHRWKTSLVESRVPVTLSRPQKSRNGNHFGTATSPTNLDQSQACEASRKAPRKLPRSTSSSRCSPLSVLSNRTRLSWIEIQQAKRRRCSQSKRSIVWKAIPLGRKTLSGLEYLRRSHSPQIWRLVARTVPFWAVESNDIFNAITRGQYGSSAVPKDRLRFAKSIHTSPGTSCAPGSVYQAWMKKSWRGKSTWWRHALYYALMNSPMDALKIINDISRRHYLQIPSRIIADVLLIFDGLCDEVGAYTEPKHPYLIPFCETVCQYLDQYTKRGDRVSLSWSTIRRLSLSLDVEHLRKFVSSIQSSKVDYNVYTKLHTMSRYLGLNHLDDALELFSTLNDFELGNHAVQWFCVTVLRLPWQVEDIHSYRKQLTQSLLDRGLSPNCNVRNAIIQNYLESGDRESAWTVLETIHKTGLATSEHTYALFLRHTSLDDTYTVNKIYDMACEANVLPRAPFLAGYFIQVAALGRFAQSENSFEALLALYRTCFDTADLEDFGMLNRSEGTSEVMQSSSFALKWMLLSWIHEHRDHPEKLTSMYSNYQFHLRNNHPRISLLASETNVGTSFVLAFGRHKAYLHMCTKVLQDMIQPDKPVPLPSYEDNPDVPSYETFLEPEDPDEIDLPIVEDKIESPAYEAFLEPAEPEENSDQSSMTINPKLGVEIAKIQNLQTGLRRIPYAYVVAPPKHRTWNALLSVLLRHGQTDSAENVIRAMLRLGIQPEQVTWKSFIKGIVNHHLRTDIDLAMSELSNTTSQSDTSEVDEAHVWKKSTMLKRFEANLNRDDVSDGYSSDAVNRVDINNLGIHERAALLNDWSTTAEMESRY